jgi:AraC-like DNA-binding protein
MISNLMRKREKQIADLRTQLVFEVKDSEYTSIDKQFLEKAVGVVGDHISDESFSQSDFAAEMAVSKTVLTEKMKSLTGFTPVAFIINTRLAVAYKTILKETGKIRVSDLAYSVGFADAKYFSKSLKAKFGKSPKELIDEVKEIR